LQQKDWTCAYCGRDRKFVVSRGIERAAEEISRAFPKIPIVLSFGDVIKKSVEAKPSFVLSTPGATPYVDGGYSAVVVLEGLTYFSHDDLRASERAIELFFETAALVRSGGVVLLSIDETHPIVSSLIRWNPAPILKRELQSRSEIVFPPAVMSAVLTLPTNQASTVAIGIKQASDDGRISKEVRVLGPTKVNTETSKIVLLSPLDTRETLTALLHELMRRRSIARKADAVLRIDPYSL
jgi:primosomal protein N' (replication factor Y)